MRDPNEPASPEIWPRSIVLTLIFATGYTAAKLSADGERKFVRFNINRWSSVLLACAAIATASACSKGVKKVEVDPYLVPRSQVREGVSTIAVAPVRIPDGLPNNREIEAHFTALIEEKLHEGRFSILFPYEYASFWDEALAESGNPEDVASDDRDHAKIAAVTIQVLDRLGIAGAVQGVLVPTVKVVEAPFAAGKAEWDGTSQSIKSGNLVRDFLAGSPNGTVGALSLVVSLYNMDGDLLYEKGGGIQVLSLMEGKDFVLVPRNELFKDDDRIAKSVDIALHPLVD